MVLALLLLSLVPSTEHVNTRVHLTYPTSHLRHYYTDLDGKHHSYSVHGRLPGPHVLSMGRHDRTRWQEMVGGDKGADGRAE